jgi:hypothetical protein
MSDGIRAGYIDICLEQHVSVSRYIQGQARMDIYAVARRDLERDIKQAIKERHWERYHIFFDEWEWYKDVDILVARATEVPIYQSACVLDTDAYRIVDDAYYIAVPDGPELLTRPMAYINDTGKQRLGRGVVYNGTLYIVLGID